MNWFIETGDINRKKIGRSGRRKNATGVEQINQLLVVDPTLSTRQLKAETGIQQSSIVRCLHKNSCYPYKFVRVQELAEDDPDHRFQFCDYVLDKEKD